MKALIPAAGHGTRFAPWTKLIPKELLPIGSRPAIACIVEEAIEAGADEIVIVTSPEKPLLKQWFEIEPAKVKITWVEQLEQRGLGHAVLQAAAKLEAEKEPILILLGDAIVCDENASRAMCQLAAKYNVANIIGCETVPREKVSRYGIMKPHAIAEMTEDGFFKIDDIVEKPDIESAPSNLAVAGRYLLSASIFRYLVDQSTGAGGEIQLTDAIGRLLHDMPVFGYKYKGRRCDVGNPRGYLNALRAIDGNDKN